MFVVYFLESDSGSVLENGMEKGKLGIRKEKRCWYDLPKDYKEARKEMMETF